MLDKLVNLLVGSDNEEDIKRYARLVSLFGLAMVANSVRCKIRIPKEPNYIPINVYGVGFAGSGLSKSKSVGYIKDWIKPAMDKIKELANERISILEPFETQEIADLTKDGVTVSDSYKSLTDASTLKLMRVLDIAGYGSINYIMDEFASTIMRDYEMLSSTILEIYDKGYVPVNLRATSKVSKCEDAIPLNMLSFGSPHLLFEGDTSVEKAFFDLLQQGLARRSLFVNVESAINKFTLDHLEAEDTIKEVQDVFIQIVDKFSGERLTLSEKAEALYHAYHTANTEESMQIDEYEVLEKIYAKNKYWIALKICGLISVSKLEKIVSEKSLKEAIQIVEDSYEDYKKICRRPEKYEIVVDWLSKQTLAQNEYTLTQKLPFYKEIRNKKQFVELMKGYAYQNNITLMISNRHNITFYEAKNKRKTDLTEPLLFSYSLDNMTEGYKTNDKATWADLYKLVSSDVCYSAHCFRDGYRKNDNAIEGFQFIILDIDKDVSLELAKTLFSNYTYLMATTKSHQKEKNGVVEDRFRIILPMKNVLELDTETYSKFMKNVFRSLPIEVDELADAGRFFYGVKGCEYWYNEGELFDGDAYVPNTQEEEMYIKKSKDLSKKNIDGLGQYILMGEHSVGRNQSLIKYAFVLNEKGYTHDEAKAEIINLNKQFSQPLAMSELEKTIFKTLTRREEIEVDDEEEYKSYGRDDDEEDEFSRV